MANSNVPLFFFPFFELAFFPDVDAEDSVVTLLDCITMAAVNISFKDGAAIFGPSSSPSTFWVVVAVEFKERV